MTNQSTERTRDRSRIITVRRVIAAVLIVLAIVFIVENREKVDIRLIVPLLSLPLWTALTGMFVIGGIAGWLLSRRRAARR
jgi:uncharacterized integral membrane protein